MTTGRRPTFDDLDASHAPTGDHAPITLDGDDTPPHGLATGSHDHPPIHVTPTDLRDSEWGRALEARLAAHDTRWKWTRRGLAVLGPAAITALGLGLGWLRSDATKSGVASEREIQRVDDHRLLRRLADAVAEIRGELRALSRMGAVHVQGPAPEPLLPDDDGGP